VDIITERAFLLLQKLRRSRGRTSWSCWEART